MGTAGAHDGKCHGHESGKRRSVAKDYKTMKVVLCLDATNFGEPLRSGLPNARCKTGLA